MINLIDKRMLLVKWMAPTNKKEASHQGKVEPALYNLEQIYM